jgi:predicted ABC-type ATPase
MEISSNRKKVFILVGPKGSGKTHIGMLLEKEFELKFLNVEKMGLENIPKSNLTGEDLIKEGFHLEEKEIDRILLNEDFVSFENTGAHDYFYVVLERLRTKYIVDLIRIFSPLDTCDSRIKRRDASAHIPVSDEMIKAINQRAATVDLEWSLVIDNSEELSDEKIVDLFRKLLQRS